MTMTTTTRLTGTAALDYARAAGCTLCSYTDPTAEGREGLTVAEAEEIAREDAGLVYVDAPATAETFARIDSYDALKALASSDGADAVWPAVDGEQNWDEGWTALTLEDGTVVVVDGGDVYAHASMADFRAGMQERDPRWVMVGEDIYKIDSESDDAEARQAMSDAGVDTADVWAGEGYDAVKTGAKVVLR